MTSQTTWTDRKIGGGSFSNTINGVFISYQPNDFGDYCSYLDSANPETAIVIIDGKSKGRNRYLIYRGDWREELEPLHSDVEALKEHWKEHGGHFWSDSLDND